MIKKPSFTHLQGVFHDIWASFQSVNDQKSSLIQTNHFLYIDIYFDSMTGITIKTLCIICNIHEGYGWI